jgi:hypothetical protein
MSGFVGKMSSGCREIFSDPTFVDRTIEELNLDRLLNAHMRDVRMARSKVEVIGRAIRLSATAQQFSVNEIERSIIEEEGFRAALDCDVLFSCVDRPWPRSVLNYISYAHLIPVIDGGILVTASRERGLHAADWRAHLAARGDSASNAAAITIQASCHASVTATSTTLAISSVCRTTTSSNGTKMYLHSA